jgi:phosphoglycolate phosphatase
VSAGLLSFSGRPVEGVLFDLDGTLLDTVGDIARALNAALTEAGFAARPLGAVRAGVGRGAAMLIRRVLVAESPDAATEERLLERFFTHYEALHAEGTSHSPPFPGVVEGLGRLSDWGVPMAVVTNKRQDLAVAALEDAGLLQAFRLVVGGDTCPTRKPEPGPLLHALGILGVAPARALMVGDSANDVHAARAAGLPVLCVPYGYTEGSDPRSLPADAFIESIGHLPGLLRPDPA